MSDPEQMSTPLQVPGVRRLFLVAACAAVLGLIITLSFGYADHDPRPHGVRIAVSAPAGVTSRLAAGLAAQAPGGFRLITLSSPAAATASVRSQSAAGALVVPVSGPDTIVTAGAAGTLQQQVITKALTAASTAMGRDITALDVAPLPAADHAGLGAFVFGLGILIPSVIGSLGLFLLGAARRLWWRVAAGVVFAFLAACGGTLAMDTVLGSLTGNGGALVGIGFLGALSFVLFVAALQSLVGLPGTGLAAVAFIFVGNAISGGSVPVTFLPGGFRQIAPWLPNNAIVQGVRDVVYFHGQHLGHTLLVLGIWPVVALAVLIGVDVLHTSERRRGTRSDQEIYQTPGIVHLRRRLAAWTVRLGRSSGRAHLPGATLGRLDRL